MAIDNDLLALLPDPPPPRPARREAAVDEALRRFDAGGRQAQTSPSGPRSRSVRNGWGRPQIAALASVVLVIMVSVPIWWAEKDQLGPVGPQDSPPAAPNLPGEVPVPAPRAPQQSAEASSAPLQPTAPDQPAESDALSDAPTKANSAPLAPAPLADARSQPEAREEAAPRRTSGPPPAAPAARQATSSAEAERSIVVTGARVARQDFESNSPMVSVNEALVSAGDWNTCTILDPRRDLSACRAFAGPVTPRRANTQLADGLALAWQGEVDRAIDAFDRAIRAAPDLSVAYLNRGLAYQAKGDLSRALADLNRAVAGDRGSARGYYHRSLLHRARGDASRADADAKRAIELDPAYQAVLP